MTRLPSPGADSGTWGVILNEYLSQVHNPDGSLKDNSVGAAQLQPGAVDSSVVADNSIAESNLDAAVVAKLNAVGGTPGATGATGPQGIQGYTGLQGFTGPQGPQGPIGATGVQGSQGDPGVAGAQGIQGIQGTAGPAGATGVQGQQGFTGPEGATGPQGVQGPVGATGAQGPQGFTGPEGATGAQGVQGAVGATGTTGSQGATGPAGQDGTSVTITGSVADAVSLPVGLGPADAGKGYLTNDNGHLHVWSGSSWTDVGVIRGPEGSTGATGAQGIQGIQGATGAQGIQGATGPQGIQGIQGIMGATGTPGATGAQGIQGPVGATGVQGIQGIPGATGPQGTQGVQGIQGTQGAQGATGPAGATTIAGITGLQAALDAKSPLASPTFSGTVSLPSTTSIGTVSSSELGYLTNVTSDIQTQLNWLTPKMYTATIAADVTPTSGNHVSLKFATQQYNTGDWTIAFSGDCWVVPVTGLYQFHLQVYWKSSSTGGNRGCGIYLNPSATTWNSGTEPNTEICKTKVLEVTSAGTYPSCSGVALLNANDLILCVTRTTQSNGFGAGIGNTFFSATLLRQTA